MQIAAIVGNGAWVLPIKFGPNQGGAHRLTFFVALIRVIILMNVYRDWLKGGP